MGHIYAVEADTLLTNAAATLPSDSWQTGADSAETLAAIDVDSDISLDTLTALDADSDTSSAAAVNAFSANDALIPPDTTYGVPKIFFLHEKRSVKSTDTLIAPQLRELASSPASPQNDYGGLSVAGYKSFGFSVGELGEINLEQGLEVTVSGEVRPGTTLSAHLSDEGTTIDGATREISDFDMMNVRLTNKKFSVVAGDQYALWPEGGILSGQKKIVGISASVTPGKSGVSVSAFGSFSGGNHTVQTVRGREGVQGPYYLTGRSEAGIITPVDGTVKVRVNGKDLAEGRDMDFIVDYDIGAVTFNPRVLIRQEDLIRIEYEYKAFDYRRTFAGGGVSYRTADSVFSIRGNLWSESDEKNNPIEMELSEEEKEILRGGVSGSAYLAPTARAVSPQDVAKMSVYYPLYKKVDNDAGDTILVYAPYNPLRPDDIRDFYTAVFTPAQTGTAGADYVINDTIQRGQFVYRYAGKGLGNYTALAPIAAPVRETAGEIDARLKLRRVSAALNVAGKDNDKNLFSTLDNHGNLSSAVMFKLNAGEKTLDRRTLWANVDYRYRSRNFRDEIFSANERKERWDETSADSEAAVTDGSNGREFQSWETKIGGTAAKGVEASVGAGQTFIDSMTETEKVTGDARTRFMRDKMGFDVSGAFFKHHLSDIDISYRRQAKLSYSPSKTWESFIQYGDEWRADTAGRGGGHVSGTAETVYRPMNLRQNVNFTQYRRGESFFESADSGYALTWTQSAAFNPLDRWRLSGDGRWRSVKIYDSNGTSGQNVSSTFLMSAVSEIEPTSMGFSSRQEYRVNQELASRFEQKMFYIGKGLGTHAFDSTVGEFRPSANGDHIVQEVEIYDNVSSTTVRKTTLSGDWYFRPAKKIRGILNDLTFSGVLLAEEHIDARNRRAASYIPGFLSLFPPDDYGVDTSEGAVSSRPTYTDLSYRQDIDYHVSGSIYKSRLYLLPCLRFVRGYKEPTFETAVKTERKKGRLLLSLEPKYLSVKREPQRPASDKDNSERESDCRDISVEFAQSVEFWKTFEFYVRERGGKIFNNANERGQPVSLDSSAYFHIKPGITHRPKAGGSAELSYMFSYLPCKYELDYRMAGGQRPGTSHIITAFSDINAGKHFNLSGLYRGELSKAPGEENFAPMTHVFSLRVKAFL